LLGRNGLRSLALAGGVALHAINVYVATTILPSVVKEIGGLDLYAWNTTLFVVLSIIGSALSARLLQASGPRAAYLIACAAFAAGTILCASAQSMPMLLAGRGIQGLGGGILVSLSYAMIRLIFPESLWPRAMALVSGMWGVATLVGPAIGGIFAQADAWRWAFLAVLPVTAGFAVLAAVLLPRRDADRGGQRAIPMLQLALLTGAVLAISAGSIGTDTRLHLTGIAMAIACGWILVAIERRRDIRLLPKGTFTANGMLGPLYATMALLAATVTSSEVFIPLFLQVLHGQSPLVAGYLAALMAGGWTIGSVVSSGAETAAVRRILIIAPWLMASGMGLLAMLLPRVSQGDWATLAMLGAGLGAIGIGVGIAWPHLLSQVLRAAPQDEADLASASITTIQLFATAAGAALAGMIVNLAGLTDPGGIAGAANAAAWLFILFAGIALAALPYSAAVARNAAKVDAAERPG
jgi:MFS family permease